jgi:hypothetical protein
MAKREEANRFGPGQWATFRDTGEHVKVESWSGIAASYRVRSRKNGLQFATEAELEEISTHPEVHLGKHWNLCQVPGCGAPLTPELPICPKCQAPTCTCGRCRCSTARSRSGTRKKTTDKRATAKAG